MRTFSIDWGAGLADGCPVLQVTSAAGAVISFRWESPFAPDELGELAEKPLCFGGRPAGGSLRDAEVIHVAADPAEVGRRLYQSLFKPAVRDLLIASRGALRPGEQLQLELLFELEDPAQLRLYALPWELLHDGRDFLALTGTPVVRRPRLALERVADPPEIDALRILAVVLASTHLDVDREIALLEQVRSLRPGFELGLLRGPTLVELRRQLEEGRFHGLHLIGHGRWDASSRQWGLDSAEGFLGAAHLALQLGRNLPWLRLVVLNSCRSGRAVGPEQVAAAAGVATALMLRGAPAVVAMQAPISDAAALRLPFPLYQNLARHGRLGPALAETRLDLQDGERNDVLPCEWAIPVQLDRTDGPLVRLRPRQTAPPALGVGALAAGGAGALLLVATAAVWLAHPPALAALSTTVAGLAAAFARKLAGTLAASGDGSGLLRRLAGGLAGRRALAGAFFLLPLAALGTWLAWGAGRLAALPCLSAAPPGSNPEKLVGLGLDAAWALHDEVRDLMANAGLEPIDLASPGGQKIPPGCYRYRIESSAAIEGESLALAIHERGQLLADLEEPESPDRDRAGRALLRQLEGLLAEARPPALDPLSPSYARNAEALRAYAAGDPGHAVELLRLAVRRDGDAPVLRSNLGRLLVELGEGQLEQAAFLPDAEIERAERLHAEATERFAEARPHFERALAAYGADDLAAAPILYNRSRLHRLLGDAEAARRDLELALARWPSFAEAANDLAVLDLEEGRNERAVARLDEALRWSAEADPTTAGAIHKNLGRAHHQRGELAEAAAALARALDLLPAGTRSPRAEALVRLATVQHELLGPATACATWRRYAEAGFPFDDPDPARRSAFVAFYPRCAPASSAQGRRRARRSSACAARSARPSDL